MHIVIGTGDRGMGSVAWRDDVPDFLLHVYEINFGAIVDIKKESYNLDSFTTARSRSNIEYGWAPDKTAPLLTATAIFIVGVRQTARIAKCHFT